MSEVGSDVSEVDVPPCQEMCSDVSEVGSDALSAMVKFKAGSGLRDKALVCGPLLHKIGLWKHQSLMCMQNG